MRPLRRSRGKVYGTANCEINLEAAVALKILHIAWVQTLTLSGQSRQRSLTFKFSRWSKHTRAGRASFAAQRACIRQSDPNACSRESPGNAGADNSRPYYDDVRTIRSHTLL